MVWLMAFVVMLLCVAGMAVGVMMGRKPIAGSCGGIGAVGVDKACGICGGDTTKCEEASAKAGVPQRALNADLARDATKVD
ncbi:MAG: (Na+)-NQR maturation NqrM [Pseudomonadaceae bacterium]